MFQTIKSWFSVNDEPVSDSGIAEPVVKPSLDASGEDKLSGVINLVKDWGSHVVHKVVQSGEEAVHIISDKTHLNEVGSTVRGVVDKVPILRDFQRLQDDFAAEQASRRGVVQSDFEASVDSVLLPWHPDAAGVTDVAVLDKLRTRVLELSKHRNTFLVSPPTEANVDDEVFRSPDNIHLAKALLENDPNLSEMRYKLVPNQVREDLFWRNYFYRLSIVRQSFQLSAMADSGSDEFVCVDQDSTWYQSTSEDSTVPESSAQPVQPTATAIQKQRPSKRTNKRQLSDHPQSVAKSTVPPTENLTSGVVPGPTEGAKTAALETAPNPTTVLSNPAENSSEIEELTAEELLEAELASDLSAFDLAASDDAQLDHELELEILAELDGKQTE